MRLTGSRTYYRPSPPKMPSGLMDLMEGLTREVLKHNPSDVYGFCVGHMQQLLDKRDGPSLKKTLSLEKKIAIAQGKVRQRVENRRQEYDKNTSLQHQNSDPSNITEPENITSKIPEDVSVIIDKDTVLLPEREKEVQNIIKNPIHHEQAVEVSGEIENSQDSGSSDSKPRDNLYESQDKEEKLHDPETVDVQISEQCQNDIVTAINEQSGNSVANHISSSMKPDTENVNKDIIDQNISDTSKSLNLLNKNQENSTITKETQHEIHLEKLEPLEVESKKDVTLEHVDNIPNDNGKEENSANLMDLEEKKVNEAIETRNTLSESHNQQVNSEKITENEKVTIEDVHSNKENGSNTSNETENNIKQIEHDEDNILSAHIDDKPNPLLDKTDELRKSSEISPELILEDVTERKFEDVGTMNKAANNDDVCDKEEHNENTILKLNDTNQKEKMHTPKHYDPVTGADSDIRTLVTENSMTDKHEVNDAASLKSITVFDNMSKVNNENSNLELISVVSLGDYNKQDDKDTVESILKDSVENNDTTSQDDTWNNKNEKNQNENQGTNMDLETAAITIQKVFRNFLFKSRGSTFEDTANDEGNFLVEDDKNKEECNFSVTNSLNTDRRAHGITRMDTVLQTVNEEKSLSLSTDDSSTLSSAATIIQAHVRGFLVRNRLNSNKTLSTISLAASNSNEPSYTSMEAGSDQIKNKNVLNIHIVPEGENCLSRDESLITSIDLSLDSPPSSINLHPLGYDKSERRKLKREDAIQSISPPSNNSGKLSEDFDSVKELSVTSHDVTEHFIYDDKNIPIENVFTTTDVKENEIVDKPKTLLEIKRQSLTKMSSDEMDVVTPFASNEDLTNSNLMHSGEFHDAVLPTKVSRSDTSVVSGE